MKEKEKTQKSNSCELNSRANIIHDLENDNGATNKSFDRPSLSDVTHFNADKNFDEFRKLFEVLKEDTNKIKTKEKEFGMPANNLLPYYENVCRKSKSEINHSRNTSKIKKKYKENHFKSYNDFEDTIFESMRKGKLYFCPVKDCGKNFPTLGRIKRHYIIHTDIKPFKCKNNGCDRRFSRKDNMLQHYRMHCSYGNNK